MKALIIKRQQRCYFCREIFSKERTSGWQGKSLISQTCDNPLCQTKCSTQQQLEKSARLEALKKIPTNIPAKCRKLPILIITTPKNPNRPKYIIAERKKGVDKT